MSEKVYLYFSFTSHGCFSLFFYFFVLVFNSSCGFLGEDSNNEDSKDVNSTINTSTLCSDSSRCQVFCNKLFKIDPILLEQCLDAESDDVANINAAISSMKKGNWNSINDNHLSSLIDFDASIWPYYAGVNDKILAQDMLLWVAKSQEIAKLLDEDHKVLRKAFSVLGASAIESELVFEGMKKDVDRSKLQSFFEVSVLENNDIAFKAAHKLLKEDCDDVHFCIKRVYCDVNQTIVFGKLNELNLGGEADLDGDNLHLLECNNIRK